MSLADLQLLASPRRRRDDLDAITRPHSTQRTRIIWRQTPSAPSATAIDWPRLLLAGSILARSDQRRDQEAALRIATAAISLTDGQALKDAGAVLLGKLSNFRAIALATNRGLLTA